MPTVDVSGTTDLPLEWSATIALDDTVSSVVGDDEDVWQIPFEWSCVLDLDPADDVEGDP